MELEDFYKQVMEQSQSVGSENEKFFRQHRIGFYCVQNIPTMLVPIEWPERDINYNEDSKGDIFRHV